MPVLMPSDLATALALLAGDGVLPIAGGTDLMVDWPQHSAAHQRTYLDLSGLRELRPLEWTEEALLLGGLTTYWDVLQEPRARRELPLLVAAAQQVGAVQIQTRGTWAGNIINASPAADGVPVLMVYDASVELISSDGSEEIPLDQLYLGYKKLRRRPDQLIRRIRVPRRRHDFERFEKVGSRRAQAITKVGVALAHSASHGWRVVVNSVAATVRRCRALEAQLDQGANFATPAELLPLLAEDIAPIDDIRSTAEYRRQVLARVIFQALQDR